MPTKVTPLYIEVAEDADEDSNTLIQRVRPLLNKWLYPRVDKDLLANVRFLKPVYYLAINTDGNIEWTRPRSADQLVTDVRVQLADLQPGCCVFLMRVWGNQLDFVHACDFENWVEGDPNWADTVAWGDEAVYPATMKPWRKEIPVAKKTNGKPVGYAKPPFLATVLTETRVTVPKTPLSDADRGKLLDAFKDAVHSLTNNTIRAAGYDLSEAESEGTWATTAVFVQSVERAITNGIVIPETRRTEYLKRLTEAQNRVNSLRIELGVDTIDFPNVLARDVVGPR